MNASPVQRSVNQITTYALYSVTQGLTSFNWVFQDFEKNYFNIVLEQVEKMGYYVEAKGGWAEIAEDEEEGEDENKQEREKERQSRDHSPQVTISIKPL